MEQSMRSLALIIFLLMPSIVFAGSYTSNYDLYKPSVGDKNWGVAMNENLDKIDTAINSITVSGGSMTYPASGIALSTGSAWGTSITNNSANWNTAYGWGNHASAGYLTSVTSDSTWTGHNSYPSACSAGQYVSALGDTLTCGTPTDTNTTYTATANRGLLLTSSTQFGLIETCSSGELLKWNGSAWACAVDGGGTGGLTNLDGGTASTNYTSVTAIDGGGA
jgi:hypothetical protein